MINTFSPLRASHCLSAPAQTCHQFSDLPSASLVFLTCMYPSVHPCSFLEKRETQQGKKGTEREEIGGFGVGGGGGGLGYGIMPSNPSQLLGVPTNLLPYFRTSVLPSLLRSYRIVQDMFRIAAHPPTRAPDMGELEPPCEDGSFVGKLESFWRNRSFRRDMEESMPPPPPPPPPSPGLHERVEDGGCGRLWGTECQELG